MLEPNGRIAIGTPLHRLQSLLAGKPGAVVSPLAGDLIDTIHHHFDDPDEIVEALQEAAEEKLLAADGRPGVHVMVRTKDLAHLVNLIVNPSAPSAPVEPEVEEQSKKKSKGGGRKKPETGGDPNPPTPPAGTEGGTKTE